MDRYYYFVAQLPLLLFDKSTDLTIEAFLAEAAKWLRPVDLIRLKRVGIEITRPLAGDPAVVARYKGFDHRLRTELAEWRRTRGGRQDFKPTLFPVSLVKEGNPLQVEKKLIRLRWRFLDEMEFGHAFDLDFIIIYYLKLQLLKRLDSFDKEIGREKFKQYTAIEAYE